MTKVTSRLLTFLLSFAMVFTSIGWLGVSEVNAAVDNTTLYVQVKDGDTPVQGVQLELEYQGEESDFENIDFDTTTDENGIASYEIDNNSESVWDDDYYLLKIKGDSEYTFSETVVRFGVEGSDTVIDTINGEAYSATADAPFVFAVSKQEAQSIDYVAIQAGDQSSWGELGISYAAINEDDFILDVRADDRWESGHIKGSTHVDVTKAASLTEDGKYVAEGSDAAQGLDAAYAAAGDKRIVIICNGGQTLAARAMQYLNTAFFEDKGFDKSKITYLIGGAGSIPEADLVTKLDYVDMQANDKTAWGELGIAYDAIGEDDFILDVRPDARWEAGHLKGSTHVDVTKAASLTEDGKYIAEGSDAAQGLDAAYTAAGDKRIVIICNGGQTLAARAMQYYNTASFEGEGVDKAKITYLIGGAGVIPAADLVTEIDYVQVQKDAAAWDALGIDYADIDKEKDFILDVRPDANWESGHLAGATHVNVNLSDATQVKDGYVVAGSQLAQDLDAAYTAAGDKRIVVVCVRGQVLAARTLQYYNEKNFEKEGVDAEKVTYLRGGATAIPEDDLVVGPAPDTTVPRTEGAEKTQMMTVNIDMSKYPAGKTVKVWVPVPQTEDYQKVSEPVFEAKTAKTAQITTEEVNGNKMLYIEWDEEAVPAERIATLTYVASRVEAGHTELKSYDESAYEFPEDVQPYITKTSDMVKIDGIVKEYADEITKGKTGTLPKAKAIYNWIVNNLERIDNGETLVNAKGESKKFAVEGCGYGDTIQIITDFDTFGMAGGHCTDLNSTFVALCRAAGVPAREMFGIRMNADATGGQHCWAEFYLPGTGWVFADPGDALKAVKPALDDSKTTTAAQWDAARKTSAFTDKTAYFWGTVDNNRVVLSRGRDITFNPPQSWGTCNTFGYPAAEVDGERLPDFTDAKNFVYTIASTDYDSSWTVDDFTFDGTVVTGLTASGAFKRSLNKDLVIPEKNADGDAVTEIGAAGTASGTAGTFATSDEKFDTVTLPETITKIGNNAFRESGIKSINFPEGLKEIGASAFMMTNLEDIDLPDGLTTLGNGAFTSITTLKSVHIPEGEQFTEIPASAFGISTAATAENFTEVKIPSNIKTIGQRAFSGNAFTEIEIPASVTTIGNYAFSQQPSSSKLEKITLNEGLVSIGGYAFQNCSAKAVILPSTVTTLNANAFRFSTTRDKVKVLTDRNIDELPSGIVKSNNWHEVVSQSEYVTELINALPAEVTTADKAQIEEAREIYDALGEESKAALTANGTTAKLEAAEAKEMAAEAIEAKEIAEQKAAEAEAAKEDAEQKAAEAEAAKEAAEAKQAAAEAAQKAAEQKSGNSTAVLALARSLVDAADVDTSAYKAKGVKAFKAAIESAKKVLAKSNATKEELEKADSALTSAKKALVKKSANPIKVQVKKVTVKKSKVKKKAVKVKAKKAFKVTKAKGKVTYKKTKGNKKITVSSKGKITVKKGLKKGTYKIKVTVTAAGDGDYKAGSKKVTLKVKVK